MIAGRNFGGFGVIDTVTGGTDSYAFAFSTSAAGSVGMIAPVSTTALPTSGGVNGAVNYSVSGSLTYANVAVNAVGSLNINSASAGTLTLNCGANQFKPRAGVILQGNGDFTITSTNGSSLSAPSVEDDPFWVMGSRNLTLALPFGDNGDATGITKLGTGTLTMAASCTATGPTYLDQGTILLSMGTSALPSGGFWSAPGTLLNSNPGAGQLVKLMGNSAGNSANSRYSGGAINGTVTISSGSLQIGGNGESINTSVNGNGTLILGGGNGLVSLNSLPANNGGTYINGSGNVAINTTLSLSGSNTLTGEFYTGNNGGAGNVTVSGGTFNIGSFFEIGRLYASTASNSTTSSFTISGPGTVVNSSSASGSFAEIGWSNGSGGVTTGILTVNNGATFSTNNGSLYLGQNYNGGSGQAGIVTIGSSSSDSAYLNLGSGGFYIGNSTGSSGSLTVNGGSLSTGDIRTDSGAGTFTLNAGLVTTTGWIRPGFNAGAVATYTINGGTLTNTNRSSNSDLRLAIGENGTGTFTINGGLVRMTNPGNVSTSDIYVGGNVAGTNGTGTLNINGGTLSTVDPYIYVGANTNCSGTITMSNGQVFNTGGLVLGNSAGATGVLNLNGGLFQANTVSGNGGSGTFNFGGGTLQISGNAGYIGNQGGGLSVYIAQSAAVIDTNGNTIQALVPFAPNPSLGASPDGGLIKKGGGVLGLSATGGQSTYQGATVVSGGTLLVTGGFTSTSGISVAGGAALGGDGSTSGVTLAAGGILAPGYTLASQAIGGATPNPNQVGTISPASLTSTGGVLSFKLSNSSSTGNDQIDVTGNVSLTNVTFNISNLLNGSLQSGSYDLLNYGSSSSLTGLSLTGLPLSRQTYALDTTSSANMVLLDVSAASPGNLIWLGTSSTTWDTTTQNWFNTGASAADKFYNLDNVSFTDLGAAHGNISVSSSFTIGALNVSLTSAASSYTFSGTGYLTGVAGLVMSGSGAVTINTPNTLTGETDVHGGSLAVGASGAIGDASNTNVTYIAGPTSGDSASATINGGTLSGSSIVIAQAAGSSGTLTHNGGLVNAANGLLVIGNSGAGTYALSSGKLSAGAMSLGVAAGASGSMTQNGGVVNLSSTSQLSIGIAGSGSYTIGGSGALNLAGNNGYFLIGGFGTTSVGSFTQNDNSVVNLGSSASGINFASISAGGNGTYTLNSGTLNVFTSGNQFSVGDRSGGTAAMFVNGGVATIKGGFYIGKNTGSQGTVTQTAGFVDMPGSGNNMVIGLNGSTIGAYNLQGGTLTTFDTRVGNGGQGTFMQTGGVVNVGGWLRLGEAQTGVGLYDISAGTIIVAQMARIGEEGSGTLNMSSNAVMTVAQNLTVGLPIDNTALPGSGVVNIFGSTTLSIQQRFVDGDGGGTGVVNIGGNALVSTSLAASSDNTFAIGDSTDGAGNLNTSGTLNMTAGTLNSLGEFWVGNGAQGNGTLNLSGGVLAVSNWFVVGRIGATGLVNMTGGSLSQQTNNFNVASGNGAQGTFNQSGGTVNVGGQLLVPISGDITTLGTYNLSGSGELITNSWLAVGRAGGAGAFNFSGGTLVHTANNHITIGSGGTGVFTMTGGLLVDSATSAFVGEASAGTLNIAGGAGHFNQLLIGVNAGQSGTIDLTGGLLSTTAISLSSTSSTATLYLEGGTLQAANGAMANFISGLTAAYVDSGTTTIDTNGNTITIAQSLLAGNGSGGLTVAGDGELILSGTNTYLGGTTVEAGTLILTNNEAIDQGTSLTVGQDASSIFAPAVAPGAPGSIAAAPGGVTAVPEPGTLALLAAGAVGAALAVARRASRRRDKREELRTFAKTRAEMAE